jgi:hypothetical protein
MKPISDLVSRAMKNVVRHQVVVRHRAAIEACKTARDERKAIKKKRRSTAAIAATRAGYTENGAVADATWVDAKSYYQTTINDGADQIHLYSYTHAEAQEAAGLLQAVQAANPVSLPNQRARAAARKLARAPTRAAGLAKHGDDTNRERRLLNAVAEAVMERDERLTMLVLMLQTTADALFRMTGMDAKLYIREQHKTCTISEHNGVREYVFTRITGYKNCLVVCECEDDGALFVARGAALHAAFENRPSKDLKITLGKKTGEPMLDKKPFLDYLGKGAAARDVLTEHLAWECYLAINKMPNALPLCTMAQANAELGKNNAVEEAGIQRWITHACGGVVDATDPLWKDVPDDWRAKLWKDVPDDWRVTLRAKPHIYMLVGCGDIIGYPEHDAQGKSDLHLFTKASRYVTRRGKQCKTAQALAGQNGYEVNLCSNDGKDGGVQQTGNTYKDGDNHEYTVTLPPEAAGGTPGEFHWWTFTNAEMVAHNYIGPNASGSFIVYKASAPCAKNMGEKGHAWTVGKHRWCKI